MGIWAWCANGRNFFTTAVTRHDELDEAIAQMHATEGAFLLEVRLEREENVFPMVPAGQPVHDIRLE